MDRNLVLAIALSLVVLMTWSAWEGRRRGETATSPPPAAAPQTETRATEAPEPAPAPKAPRAEAAKPAELRPAPAVAPEQRLRVTTPLYEAELTTHGAALTHWELAQFFDRSVEGSPRVVLTTPDAADQAGLTTPLAGVGQGDLSRAPYTVQQPDPLTVVFRRDVDGVAVTKTYVFSADSYLLRLRIEIENRTRAQLEPTFELLWHAQHRPGPDFTDQALVALHDGAVARTRLDGFGKPGFLGGGGAPESQVFPSGVDWAGAELRYFLMAFLPESPRDAGAALVPVRPGDTAEVQLGYAPSPLPPGTSAAREYRGYLGPKEHERLLAVGAHLDRSIDQGWAWMAPVTNLFAWMLRACYAVIPNYGVAIILLTILVRVVTAPLTTRQMRSMKRMGELSPRLKELQEKHKDDRQKQSEEMMKLYRETGVNPLGGCLPLVLQFPVFIGLYYALQSSIDLRQAPFFGWINDLSRPESLFTLPGFNLPVRVLPLIMGATMVLQQKMTPTTMDPQQARMMLTIMPIMFTVLFYQFPSGLVLYWMVSNLLAIAHQAWVNRKSA